MIEKSKMDLTKDLQITNPSLEEIMVCMERENFNLKGDEN